MGVDSGLPDFRGNQGFWNAYPPYAKKGLSFVEMANPSWFYKDPEFAWGFYGHRLNLYRKTTPHKGFNTLLQWGKKAEKGYFVFTSNVDGQFQKAGFDEQRIYECHGSIHHFQCLDTCGQKIFNAEPYSIDVVEETMRAKQPLPSCPSCNALVRPNILMFGDFGWDGSREEIQGKRYHDWLANLKDGELVIIECGAGTAVPTVRHQSEYIASQFRGKIIRINIREPQISLPHISLSMGASEALHRIASS